MLNEIEILLLVSYNRSRMIMRRGLDSRVMTTVYMIQIDNCGMRSDTSSLVFRIMWLQSRVMVFLEGMCRAESSTF